MFIGYSFVNIRKIDKEGNKVFNWTIDNGNTKRCFNLSIYLFYILGPQFVKDSATV